jgi:hypothetical protein
MQAHGFGNFHAKTPRRKAACGYGLRAGNIRIAGKSGKRIMGASDEFSSET